METQTQRAKLRITGKVQGVWFRASAKQKAQELELSGWIRNEPDGSVMAEAEGPKESVKVFIKWCREGSPQAQVDKVHEEWIEPKGYHSFEIKLL